MSNVVFGREQIEKKINELDTEWHETEAQIQQQFAMSRGAYLGARKVYEDMLTDLEKDGEGESPIEGE